MLLFISDVAIFNSHPDIISIHPMLLFIEWRHLQMQLRPLISIHPMLLFIKILCRPIPEICYFNTSHVTVYLGTMFVGNNEFGNFNTSHVTVYHSVIFVIYLQQHYFNTSHVTVYPDKSTQTKSITEISIHPMLLFISDSVPGWPSSVSISIHPMLLFIAILSLINCSSV